ncbi:ABC transporter G family member 23-like [Rhodnius prolixus]
MTMELEIPNNAVVVRDAYKRYGRQTVVLRGLNMTVQKGTIYGFLGPSGCGKTTLLNCVVGRITLDSGEIVLNVNSKSDIGYMPQELALNKEFSINETMNYYGMVYGMTKEELVKRKKDMYAFLDLPDENSTIEEISGGQQRRVSLSVALLHNPQLLILDEPTVGVDPLLSHCIWEHLLTLSSVYGKTIIITTHYIEDAKHAQRIGLMRGGTILAESEPKQLLSSYNCDSLERVFLHLSEKQESRNQYANDVQDIKNYPKPLKKPLPPIKNHNYLSPMHIYSHIWKNIYWLKRNKPILAFLLMLPVVQCWLFVLTIGRDPLGLKLGIVNEELQHGFDVCHKFPNITCSLDYPMSCKFMDTLEKKQINLIEYRDHESARRGVEKNHVWGYLHFSSNYTEALFDRIISNLRTNDEALDKSELKIWMDMSNQYIGNLLRRDMYFGYLSFLENVYKTCNWPPEAATVPIMYHEAVYGTNNPSFTNFAVPAVIQLSEFYLPMLFTVGALLMEKREGLLERSFISGMTLLEIMVGHAIVNLVIMSLQTLFMWIVLFIIFDNVFKGSLVLAIALLYFVGLSGMCYGYFVSAVCDTDQAATYMGLGSFFPLAMLSGMVWPFEGMHYLLRAVGWFLPLTLTTDAFRSISARSWGLKHPAVYSGFLSAIGWSAFFCITTYWIIRLKNGLRTKT